MSINQVYALRLLYDLAGGLDPSNGYYPNKEKIAHDAFHRTIVRISIVAVALLATYKFHMPILAVLPIIGIFSVPSAFLFGAIVLSKTAIALGSAIFVKKAFTASLFSLKIILNSLLAKAAAAAAFSFGACYFASRKDRSETSIGFAEDYIRSNYPNAWNR